MMTGELHAQLKQKIADAPHRREMAVDIMYRLQQHYGYMSDEALREGAELLGMTLLELEELATFYDFIYREPVGRYVIHVCDGVVCWMFHEGSVFDYLCQKLGIEPGGTSADGLFTVLPTACIGYCDHAPSMLINGRHYGSLTPEKVDEILEDLRQKNENPPIDR